MVLKIIRKRQKIYSTSVFKLNKQPYFFNFYKMFSNTLHYNTKRIYLYKKNDFYESNEIL